MAIRLCLNESTADLGTTLAGRETDLLVLGGLLDLLGSLGEDELDVAGVGHVGVDLERKVSIFGYKTPTVNLGLKTYTTVSTVSAAATLGGLVDLDALDDQGAGVETLAIGVGLSVLEQINDVLSGLDGPAGLGDTELLACKTKNCQSMFDSHSQIFFPEL